MTVLIECLHFQTETLVNGVQNMSPKIINQGSSAIPMSIKYPKVTVLLLLVQLGHKRHISMYKYIWNVFEIKMSGAINSNTPHSPSVCTVFNEIVQYFHVFP